MSMNPGRSIHRHRIKRHVLSALTAVLVISAGGQAMAQQLVDEKQKMAALKQLMQRQIGLMTPEMQQKVKALSPKSKGALLKIYAQHNRRSDTITLRQVMHEVLSDYQSIVTGLVTDNAEQAAAAARRLANHRLPRGGLLPYLKPEQVNDKMVALLVPFNNAVEGNALRLAESVEKGDLMKASDYLNKVTNGCMACHATFRGVPGKTPYLKD